MKKTLFRLLKIYMWISTVVLSLYLLCLILSSISGFFRERVIDEKEVLGFSVQKVFGGRLFKIVYVGTYSSEEGPAYMGEVEVKDPTQYPIGSKIKFSWCESGWLFFKVRGTGEVLEEREAISRQ